MTGEGNRAKRGGGAFDEFYRMVWGGRWDALRECLLKPAAPTPYEDGLAKPYLLDRASILAALALTLPGEGTILDACAAPGGKSLVLASRMPQDVKLLSNELSAERRRRLVNTLDNHLCPERRRRVTVSGFDMGKEGGRKSERSRYDAILLDAPCSSERHVIQSPKALSEWTPARPRFLAHRQWALLSSAFLLLKEGGDLVYSTCTINPEENDGPAARLMKKYRDEIEINPLDIPGGEKTEYGRLILPDRSGGMGPMYIARFRKKPKSLK